MKEPKKLIFDYSPEEGDDEFIKKNYALVELTIRTPENWHYFEGVVSMSHMLKYTSLVQGKLCSKLKQIIDNATHDYLEENQEEWYKDE